MIDYKSCFGRVKTIAADVHVQMYLLKKTSSKNDAKKREILPVDVDHEVKTSRDIAVLSTDLLFEHS